MNRKYQNAELARTRAVGAKTVVMDRPPEMTFVPGPRSQELPALPGESRPHRSATPSVMTTAVLERNGKPGSAFSPPRPPPSLPPRAAPPPRAALPPPIPGAAARPQPAPARPAKAAPARTRMVDLQHALANQAPLPPLPRTIARPPQHYAQEPAAPALLSMPRAGNRWRRGLQERRSLLAAAAVALLALLLLPQLIGEGEAEALDGQGAAQAAHAPAPVEAAEPSQHTAPAASATQPEATRAEPAQAAEIADAAPEPAPTGAISEAQAGALLLSGRRAQALASYRVLAQQPGARPGIEAMVVVLEQKVNPR